MGVHQSLFSLCMRKTSWLEGQDPVLKIGSTCWVHYLNTNCFRLKLWRLLDFFFILSHTAPVPLRGAEKAASTGYRSHHPSSEQLVSFSKLSFVRLHRHMCSGLHESLIKLLRTHWAYIILNTAIKMKNSMQQLRQVRTVPAVKSDTADMKGLQVFRQRGFCREETTCRSLNKKKLYLNSSLMAFFVHHQGVQVMSLFRRFINARRRIVQPMIDQSNRAGKATERVLPLCRLSG